MGIKFKEIGDDCSICPISKAGLCHGLANYGNGPVYPPCSELDENTDVDIYMKNMQNAARQREERRREKAKKEAEKKAKKELQKKRKRFADNQCRKEIDCVNSLKKLIKSLKDEIDSKTFDLRFSKSMTKSGIPFGDPEKMEAVIKMLENRLMETETAFDKAQKDLAAKRAAVYKTNEYKNIR